MDRKEMTALVVAVRYLVEWQGTTAVEDWTRMKPVCDEITERLDDFEKYIANLPEEFDPYLDRPLSDSEWIEEMLKFDNIDQRYVNMQIDYQTSQCNWAMADLFGKLLEAMKERDSDTIPLEETRR